MEAGYGDPTKKVVINPTITAEAATQTHQYIARRGCQGFRARVLGRPLHIRRPAQGCDVREWHHDEGSIGYGTEIQTRR